MIQARTDIRPRRHADPLAHRRRNFGAAGRNLARPTRIRLWLPLTPLWILLAPLALLLAPLLMFLPPLLPENRQARKLRAALAVKPYRTAFALGAVLLALSGTEVSVDAPGALIRIKIY
jgi:hypothetical protein